MLLINEQVNSLIESNLELEMIWSNPNSVSRIHVLFETVGKGKNRNQCLRGEILDS